MKIFSDFFTFLMNCISFFTLRDLFDIAVMAVVFYNAFKFIKNTRATQLLKGILFIVAALQVADWFDFRATHTFLKSTIDIGILALLIVFQPELRKVLEKVGRGSVSNIFTTDTALVDETGVVDILVKAVINLSLRSRGALIVIERDTKLGDIVNTGTRLDCEVNALLLENLFFTNAPLHDGAVLVSGSKIVAAGCFLPLTENVDISTDLGTRHRAGIGMSEVSDAVVVVVSEETGVISVVIDGILQRGFNKDTLTAKLLECLVSDEERRKTKFKFIPKKSKGDNKNEKED